MSSDVFTEEQRVYAQGALTDYFDRVAKEMPLHSYPRSLEEWRKMRGEIRTKLPEALGVVPLEQRSLKSKVVGMTEKKDYSIEKIVFESRPNSPVPANLYLPRGANFPVPTILCPHGHTMDGKSYPENQYSYIALAKNGYAVLSLDGIGFGERKMMGHGQVHPYTTTSPFLVGSSLQGMMVWDNVKAIDYLETRAEVDMTRIGCTGNSGGGTQTLFTMALDERVTAAVISGYVTTFQFLAEKERNICPCNILPKVMTFADMGLLIGLIAPRPVQINTGFDDRYFPFDLARKVFRRAKRIYELMGVPENIGLAECESTHDFSLPKREAMYRWFNKFLMGIDDEEKAKEPSIAPERRDSPLLRCFPEGRIPEASETVNSLVAKEATKLLEKEPCPRTYGDFYDYRNSLLRRLRKILLRGPLLKTDLDPSIRGRLDNDSFVLEKILYHSEPGIPAPAHLYLPKKQAERVIIFVCSDGKSAPTSRNRIQDLVNHGSAVFAVDLRGWGETKGGEIAVGEGGDEHYSAQRALFYDRPLMGMRVIDVIRAKQYVISRSDLRCEIGLYGLGMGAIVTCLASALDQEFEFSMFEDIPVTFMPPKQRGFDHSLSFFIPGILTVGDVPQLLSLIAPRRVFITTGLEPTGNILKGETLRHAFRWTVDAFAAANAPKKIQFML